MITIYVKDLMKSFKDKKVLNGLTFSVEEGEVFCLVAPNGAGKTTTLRILAGIIESYTGIVEILNMKPIEAKKKQVISYLPEEAEPYERFTGLENMLFYYSLYYGSSNIDERVIRRGIEIADLGDAINERTSKYSKGMKRRLLLSQVLMVDPRVVILDEPTDGLDIESSVRVRKTIKKMAEDGKTIVMSSHNMLEVGYVCKEIAMMYKGVIIEKGTPEYLMKKYEAENLEEVYLKAKELYLP
jgi:ABC-2 type transport system ATP-binding protein